MACHSVPLREFSKNVLILISSTIEKSKKKYLVEIFCKVASILELTYELIWLFYIKKCRI